MRNRSRKNDIVLVVAVGATVLAAKRTWGDTFGANGNSPLNQSGSWIDESSPATDSAPPGAADLAQFDSNDTNSSALTLGASMSWLGIVVTNPANAITINDDGSVLTLGASGINMNAATQNLTLNNAITLSAPQTWNIATGRTLTVNNVNNGSSTLSFAGAGTTVVNGSLSGAGELNVTRGTLSIAATGTVSSTQLSLGGGTFALAAGQVGANFSGGTNLTAGGSTISTSSIAGTLNLGAITRSAGAGVNFILPTSGTITTSTSNTAGSILGGWAVANGTDWAVVSGGAIAADSSYTNDAWAGSSDTTVTTNDSVSNGTTNSLRFGAAAANTVALSGTNVITSGGVLVSSAVGNNLSVINGGTLEGSAGGELIVNQYNTANSLIIGSTIADNGGATGLTEIGGGTLVLSGNNTYTGTTTVDAGTLQIGNGGTTGSVAGAISIAAGANLTMDRSDSVTLSNAISGAGIFTQAGSGTVTFNTAQNYTGATDVNNGTLLLDFNASTTPPANILNVGAPLNLGGGGLVVNGNATTAVTQSVNGSSVIAGASTISVDSNGSSTTLSLGAIARSLGAGLEFNLPANGSIQTTTTSTAAGGILLGNPGGTGGNSGANAAYAIVGTSDWAAISGGAIVAGSSVSSFYNSPASSTGATLAGNVDVTSTGELRISGTQNPTSIRFNTPTGALYNGDNNDIDQIIIKGNAGKVLEAGGILVTPNVGANNVLITDDSGAPYEYAELRPGGNGGDLVIWQNNTQGSFIVNVGIANYSNTSTYTQNGPGTVVLNGISSYTGLSYLNGGVTEIGTLSKDAGFGAPSSAATVDLNGGTVVATGTMTMDNSGANPRPFAIAQKGGGFAAVSGAVLTVDGVVSGAGPLNIGAGSLSAAQAATNGQLTYGATTGSGTVILSGANTFSGGVNINNGTLQIDSSAGNAAGSGPISVNNTSGTGYLAGTGTLDNAVSVNSGGHIAPGDAGIGTITVNSLTLNTGSVSDFEITSASLHDQINVPGTLTLSTTSGGDGINLYQPGGTNPFFASGTYDLFQIGSGGVVGNAASAFSVLDAQPNTNYTFGESGGFLTVTIATSAVNSAWAVDASGNWSDATKWTAGIPTHALDIASFPTNILSANRTVTLTDNRTVGTLNFGTPGQSNPNSYTIAAGGGTLTLDNGTSAAIINDFGGTHTIAAPISLTTHGVSISANNDASSGATSTMIISGSISGAGPVTVTGGTGTVVLSGANSYGNTTIDANATLQIGNGAASGTLGTGTVVDNGTLVFDLQGPVSIASQISSGTGGITQAGTGVLTLTASNTYSGATNVNSGTLQLGNAAAIGASSVLTVAGGATLDLNGNAATIGSLNGSGTIDNTNAAAASLTTGSLNASPTFNGTIQNTGGALSLIKNGTGVLMLSNTNTYSGGTTINAGAIKATTNGALGPGTITVNTGSGLQLGDGVTLSNDIAIGSSVGSAQFVDVPDDGATAELTGNVNLPTGNTQYRLGATGGALDSPATIIMTGASTVGDNNTIFTLGNIVFAGNGSLTTGGPFFIGRNSATSNLTLTIQDNAVVTGTVGLSLGGNGSSSDDASTQVNITGNGVLSAGTATMNLNGSTVNGGGVNVSVSGNGALEAGAFTQTAGGASVDFNGGSIIATASDPAGGQFFPNVSVNLTINSGGLTINDGGFSITIGQTLNSSASPDGGLTKIGSGTVTLSASENYNGPTIVNAGTLALSAADTNTSGITINTGATLKLLPHGPWINTGTVNINGGALDVTTNTLVFDTTVSGHDAGTLNADLKSGFAHGNWNGPGINSSSAATVEGTALGYAISGNNFTIMYTWYGDLDLNGFVNTADETAMMNGNGTSWSQGDLNYDGVKNADDWSLFFLGAAEAGSANISTVTPEPGTLGLLALGAASLLSRRRRHG